eukprot:SAG22_NODE_242_length_14104_cov_13.581935_4_plen_781_part_00
MPLHDSADFTLGIAQLVQQITIAAPTVIAGTIAVEPRLSGVAASRNGGVAASEAEGPRTAAAELPDGEQEAAAAEEEEEEELFSIDEMRSELERLRQQLAGPEKRLQKTQRHDGSGVTTAGAPVGLCRLPAGVPELPPGLQISPEMRQLATALLSLSAGVRIGFTGMGGIGKTTISAWLVRRDDVRSTFESIAWVPLGQSPNIEKCQKLLHLQLTGTELQSGLSAEDRQENLRLAMSGKKLLLVLDDCWSAADHLKQLNFVDAAAGAKVLISSRIRSVLDGATIVEVGLPSADDAAAMLLAAAGSEPGSVRPEQLQQVVEYCNCLPLAIGMTGKLVKSMSLGSDWSGVVEMLREEFRQSGHGGGGQGGRSMEESVISTSLRGITGTHRDNTLALFRALALAPEDVVTPLEVVQLMYEAAHPVVDDRSSWSPPSVIQIRRYLKMLIDRSLVLGSVDRPSLHDVVRDYVQQLFTPEALRCVYRPFCRASSMSLQCMGAPFCSASPMSDATRLIEKVPASFRLAHRRMVEGSRATRPAPRGWETRAGELNPVAQYVVAEVGHHIEMACNIADGGGGSGEGQVADGHVVRWLDDFPHQQDAIPLSTARVLGAERTSVLAQQAERAGEWWSAALRWSAAAVSAHGSLVAADVGLMAPTLLRASATALSRTTVETGRAVAQLDKDRLEFTVLSTLLKFWDSSDLLRYRPRLDYLLSSEAAREDTDGLFQCLLLANHYPAVLEQDHERCGVGVAKMCKVMIDAAAGTDDSFEKGRMLGCAYSCIGAC